LLTAPHAALRDLDPNPKPGTKAWTSRMVLGWNAIPSFERLVEIHDAYNQASREVGAELGAPVIDMARLYEERADPELFSNLDICHPTQKGHDLEAAALYDELVATGVLPSATNK
jgi:lysophospholipase L1-like esterase